MTFTLQQSAGHINIIARCGEHNLLLLCQKNTCVIDAVFDVRTIANMFHFRYERDMGTLKALCKALLDIRQINIHMKKTIVQQGNIVD